MLLRIVIWSAMALVAAGFAVEVVCWLNGTRLVTRLQKIYRSVAALIIEGLLAMVLFGGAVADREDPILEFGYWALAMMLAVALVFLVLLDVRQTLISYQERRRQMFRRLLEDETKRRQSQGPFN